MVSSSTRISSHAFCYASVLYPIRKSIYNRVMTLNKLKNCNDICRVIFNGSKTYEIRHNTTRGRIIWSRWIDYPSFWLIKIQRTSTGVYRTLLCSRKEGIGKAVASRGNTLKPGTRLAFLEKPQASWPNELEQYNAAIWVYFLRQLLPVKLIEWVYSACVHRKVFA